MRINNPLEAVINAAKPIIESLKKIGDETDWRDGDETDRVYPWYEIKPLADAIDALSSATGTPAYWMMVAALKFYAARESWDFFWYENRRVTHVEMDGGHSAKEALGSGDLEHGHEARLYQSGHHDALARLYKQVCDLRAVDKSDTEWSRGFNCAIKMASELVKLIQDAPPSASESGHIRNGEVVHD